jgi:hypothetical protein
MRLADKVQDWLDHIDWDDKISLDEENQTSSLAFTYSIKDQSFKVWIETDEAHDYFKIYIYAPFNALPKKLTECAVLFNHINTISYRGALSLVDEKGSIRWRHVIDFEGTDPSVATIHNAFNGGADLLENWFDEITEVALTKTTAQQIIDQLEAASESESSEEAVPDFI